MTFILLTLFSFSAPAIACGGSCNAECPMQAAAAAAAATTEEAATEFVGTEMTVNISGLTCTTSSGQLAAHLMTVDGVNTAVANHETGEVEINFDAGKTNETSLKEVINARGYTLIDNS